MMIHAPHPTAEGRIPPSFMNVYVRYKQDTRAIVAWLLENGSHKYKRLRTVSIRDMLGLAEAAQQKGVTMPRTIDFHFREAIAARTQLSKFFRMERSVAIEDQDTVNHEFFTAR